MPSLHRLPCAIAAFALSSSVTVSCEDVDRPQPPSSSYQISDLVLTARKPTRPAETFDVTATARNSGNVVWDPGDVELRFAGDPSFTRSTLRLAGPTQAGGTAKFSGTLLAPGTTGRFTLRWQAHTRSSSAAFGSAGEVDVDLSCDDGLFCNGTERFNGGRCAAGANPCDDGESCSNDACDEDTKRCTHELGTGCAACASSCVPDCSGRECGSDRCSGSCGACEGGDLCADAAGRCRPRGAAGSCDDPLPLIRSGQLLGTHVITSSTANGFNQAVPTCNSTSRAVERVYEFTLTATVGIDARASGFDTVLHIRREDPATPISECAAATATVTVACNDDASPPGNSGSRIATSLAPGRYYLIVDGADAAFGTFELSVRFVADGCVPQCGGRYCGDDDGCGGDCGTCDTGFSCESGRCKPDPCVPACEGKRCGDDGCGGACGTCSAGQLCVAATATCETFPACEHANPTCALECGADDFCGADCTCHRIRAPSADLVIGEQRLKNEILFETINVDAESCAVIEDCVGDTGVRKLLRFTVEATNQGAATFSVPPAETRPDLFTLSPCEGRYYFNSFARYALVDSRGGEVVTGRARAYCIEDTVRTIEGPAIACEKQFSCGMQGIQAGWSDVQDSTLDCQWLDVTGVEPGDYALRVTLNPEHTLEETSFDNNTAEAPVTISN